MRQLAPAKGKQELNTNNMLMHKTLITASLVALTLLAGCSKVTRMAGSRFPTGNVLIDTAVSITNEATPRCFVRIDMQYAKGLQGGRTNRAILRSGVFTPEYIDPTTSNEDMGKAMRELVAKYIAAYRADYAPLYKADHSEAALYKRSLSIKGRMTSARNGIITCTVVTTEQTGDAQPTTMTKAVNISEKNAHIISADDILKHGSRRFVEKAITAHLCRRFHAKDINGLRAKGILATTDAYIPDNFIIEKDGITFIFNPDEIAPHDTGEIRISIKDSESGSLLRIGDITS